jgi:fumarate reductase flavoprotein subunit
MRAETQEDRLISRRLLLGGAFAGLASSSLAVNLAVAESRRWDAVIVGGGTAGMAAALFAARSGAEVLVVEKSARLGGTLWFSGGQMSAAGTALQRSLGITDSPADHLQDLERISRGTVDPALGTLATTHAAATVDWLLASGLKLVGDRPTVGTGHEPYERERIYAPAGRGVALLEILNAQLAAHADRIQLLFETGVSELVQARPGAPVTGVAVTGPRGESRVIRADKVLLATGGHNANPALFERLTGVPLYRAPWVPQNTGAGLLLGLAAGGTSVGGENYLCDFGSIPGRLEWPANEFARSHHHPQRRPPWELIVNQRGERFLREDEPSVDARERALLAQPEQRYFLVFDDPILRSSPTLVSSSPPATGEWSRERLLEAFDRHPAFIKADTESELAQRCGMDPEVFSRTLASYNEALREGREDEYGRMHRPAALTRPPYYAILHQGSSLISFAGLAVGADLRVLRNDGGSIDGLYAAGEILGNGMLSGQCFAGGMMVTPALTFGRLFGQAVFSGA